MIILLLSTFNLLFSLDITYVPQHTFIDLKNFYIPSIEQYGFGVLNNEKGNLILQPFQDIDYFLICNEQNEFDYSEPFCTNITNIKANTDNNLGVYSSFYKSIFFLFHEELQMKFFFDRSTYTINYDINLYSRCFDYFSGYDDQIFNFEPKFKKNYTINIQFISNNSSNIIKAGFMRRDTKEKYFNFKEYEMNRFYGLYLTTNYTFYFSPPEGDNIHSMFCLTFSEYKDYYIDSSTHEFPVISKGKYEFYSLLEEEWNISSEYYPTTFNFYLNNIKNNKCNYTYYLNKTKESHSCELNKDDNSDYLYKLKIYSHRDSRLALELFFEPELIDENSHFGRVITFNKTVAEYDAVEHLNEILTEIIEILVVVLIIILIIVLCVVFCPLICEKCKSQQQEKNV